MKIASFLKNVTFNENKPSISMLLETEFSKVRFKGGEQANSVYKGFKALQPEDVADVIYFAISRPAHVNIADVLMFCTAQASSTIVKKEL